MSDVNLSRLEVAAEFTGDGRSHRTGRAVLGAAFAAGTKEGPGAEAVLREASSGNPLLSVCCSLPSGCGRSWRMRNDPKAMLIPAGALGWVADVLPISWCASGRWSSSHWRRR